METKRIKLTDLVLNEGQIAGLPTNPRQWTKTELDKLKKSLQETPELLEARGILVYPWEGKYLVLGGNMRLSALKALKATDAPCIVFPEDTPIDKLKEVVIKDNGSFGAWDFDQLANEWGDLPLVEWGVPAWETQDMSEVETPENVQEDDFDENEDKVETRCVLGDVWLLGDHRLMCGDSTSMDDIDKLMQGDIASMMFTDPPYGMKFQSAWRTETKRFAVLKNDDRILDFLPAVRNSVNGFVFVCTTWKVLDQWLPLFCKSYDMSNMIIWNKGGGGIGDLKHTFYTDYEIILCSNNGKELQNGRIGSVWSVGKDDVNTYVHPTQKPIELSGLAMKHTTNVGDIVLDVFGGSGSTMMACEQLGRKCRMMELDPHYCDVIIARWEKLTGKEAVRVE